MLEAQLEASVYEYLILEKAYPKQEIQIEAALGSITDGTRYRADLAILDQNETKLLH